jgi:N utilization substance protein A
VVLVRVEKASKGPQVVVSRAVPELVSHLFQTEVPEIYDNTVVIRAIAREAGERTKIAVMSKDKDVDPVGACVGMKGMRVQSIIRELRGEKIDIIEYHEDPVTFAEKALQPAKVSRVTVLEGQEKHLEVIVDDSQLSLAIGKKGQNVRLAAKLLGWKIDIKSEEEKRQEVEDRMNVVLNQPATPLESVPDLEPGIIEKLVAAGITTVEAVADMTPEQLEEVPGVGPKTVEKISIAVNNYFSSLDAAAGSEEVPLSEDEGSTESEVATESEAATEEAALAGDEAPTEGEAPMEGGGEDSATGPDSGGQSGDLTGLEEEPEAGPDSVEDLVETGQYYEAEVVEGIEDAPPADEAEVTTHERPAGENENVPDEEKPGEQR